MKEYKTRNKQETKVLAKVCCHNRFRSMQLKSIIDNRKGNLMSIPNSVLSYEIRQHQNDDSCFDPITYIQQMGKDEFLFFLRHRVAESGDMLLSQINQTTNDCPYIRKWFTYYSQRSVEDIVQAISRFAPLTQVASSFNEYFDYLISRIEIALQRHIDTGTIEDIPNEIKTGKEQPELFKHIQERISSTVQLSRCCFDNDEDIAISTIPEYHTDFIVVNKSKDNYVQWISSKISCIEINPEEWNKENEPIAWSQGFSGCLMAVFKCVTTFSPLEANHQYIAHVDVSNVMYVKINDKNIQGKGNIILNELVKYEIISELKYFYPYKNDGLYLRGGRIYYDNGAFSAKSYVEKDPKQVSESDLRDETLIVYEEDDNQQYLLKK